MWLYKARGQQTETLLLPLLLDTVDVIEECYCRASITLVIIIHLLLRRALSSVSPLAWPGLAWPASRTARTDDGGGGGHKGFVWFSLIIPKELLNWPGRS